MTESVVSSREKKELRGIAQRLKPAVHVGKQGVTPTILAEIDGALGREALVKVKFTGDRKAVRSACEAVENAVTCTCVGGVGRTASFYREKVEVGS